MNPFHYRFALVDLQEHIPTFCSRIQGRLVFYLRYLCLFAHSGVHPTHIVLCFCFIFHRLLYTVLTVSLDSPYLIAPSVFSNVYFHKGSVAERTFNFNVSEAKFFINIKQRNWCKLYSCMLFVYQSSFAKQFIAYLHDWLSPYYIERQGQGYVI